MASVRRAGGAPAEQKEDVMDFLGYVDRQKCIIRGRHAGEEIISLRGESMTIREGEGSRLAASCPLSGAAPRDERKDEDKSVEQLLAELAAMKGLNVAERERCCAKAAANAAVS